MHLRTRRLAQSFTVISSCLLLTLVSSAQTSFRYAAINVPTARETVANGINNGNVIVGWYISSTGQGLGFRLASGHYSTIKFPGAAQTYAHGISDLGDVVGNYITPTANGGEISRGFLLHSGVYRTIDCPNSTATARFTDARGINKYGTIVGTCNTNTGHHGFIWKNGVFTFFDAPKQSGEPTDTEFNGISNLNEIAGQVFSGDNWRGFWKVGSDLDFLRPLLARDNVVTGVNGHGEIVGCYLSKGFFAHNPEAGETEGAEHFPSLITVNPFNASNSCAESINYNRAIVGYYLDANFMRHGFLAVPQ
jgi:probable HAF family extracellular repeat protein